MSDSQNDRPGRSAVHRPSPGLPEPPAGTGQSDDAERTRRADGTPAGRPGAAGRSGASSRSLAVDKDEARPAAGDDPDQTRRAGSAAADGAATSAAPDGGSSGAASPFFQRGGKSSAAPASDPRPAAAKAPAANAGPSGSATSKATPSGSATPAGSAPAGLGGKTDRGDAARVGTAAPGIRKPAGTKTPSGADAPEKSKPAAAASQNTTRAGTSRPDTTRKHDAQTTVTTPAARPGPPADRPRDTDTISLVRPNLPKRGPGAAGPAGATGGSGASPERGGGVRNATDRAGVTARLPAERRPTPEPVRAGAAAGPAAARPGSADRTALYDGPGMPPGPPPSGGGLGPNGLSTEPLGPGDASRQPYPGPLGPPGAQPGPRGQRGDGLESARDGSGAAEAGARRPPAPGGRRARLRLSKVEPLSVTRLAFAFSLCVFLIMIVAVAVLWFVLNSVGVFDSVTDAADTLGTSTDVSGWLSFGRAMQISLLVGAINVVLMTALATLGAMLYNLCADMIGGLEVTLSDQ